MSTPRIAEQIARVRHAVASSDSKSAEWIRTALVYGVPLGALLLEADAANIASLPLSSGTPEWDAASAKAEALTGREWPLAETHELTIRHMWGLWVPHDMHEWRVFRNTRAASQTDVDYFS